MAAAGTWIPGGAATSAARFHAHERCRVQDIDRSTNLQCTLRLALPGESADLLVTGWAGVTHMHVPRGQPHAAHVDAFDPIEWRKW